MIDKRLSLYELSNIESVDDMISEKIRRLPVNYTKARLLRRKIVLPNRKVRERFHIFPANQAYYSLLIPFLTKKIRDYKQSHRGSYGVRL